MHITPLFPNVFAEEKLDIDNEQLLNHCIELEKNGVAHDHFRPKNVGFSMDGGWQSGFIDLSHESLQPLISIIQDRIEGFKKNIFMLRDDCDVKIQNGWFNRMCPATQASVELASVEPHRHANYFLSFVYYVKAEPDCGDLIIMPNDHSTEFMIPTAYTSEQNAYNASRHRFIPKTGTLVAFPTWLMHMVGDNHSGTDRISFAVNTKLPHIKETYRL